MEVFQQIEQIIQSYSTKVPLEIFVPLGALIEEILAPIPSPFVMTSAGALASAQNQPLFYLFWLAVIGALGKTLGAWVLYFLAVRAEDFVLGRFGSFLGVSTENVAKIGQRLNNNWKDILFLTLIRSLPILPSAPISVGCGLLKVPVRVYLIATLLGITLRNLIFLYFGYAGLETFGRLVAGFETIEDGVQLVLFLSAGLLIGWAYWRRRLEARS